MLIKMIWLENVYAFIVEVLKKLFFDFDYHDENMSLVWLILILICQ